VLYSERGQHTGVNERVARPLQSIESLLDPVPGDRLSPARQILLTYLHTQITPLHGIIQSYVQRMGLASGSQVPGMALDVLQETIVEALEHADRFVAGGQSIAWLLGVALNIIKRKKVESAKRQRRELQLGSLAGQYSDITSESDLLDRLVVSSEPAPEQALEDDEQAEALLNLVSSEDQRVLRLALLEGFDGQELANRLRISPGTARMRLHRALQRLRSAWKQQNNSPQKGANNV
jgi:RNA polymerase sigma factor (sigma-70 family)